MTCYYPLQAVRIDSSDNPIRIISAAKATALRYKNYPGLLQLPCGKCVGCRLSYSKSWAVRNCHEAQLCDMEDLPTSFVTLTYNDEYLPKDRGLYYRDCQLFLKRLRNAMVKRYSDYAFSSSKDKPIRFYMCGEYGGKTLRPHYHFLFYNLGFTDEYIYKVTSTGHKLFNSDSLTSFWSDPETKDPLGFAVSGSVTVESAGYVARYCVKKALQGKSVHLFNHKTGKFLPDEFTQMSRRPGIAYEWFKRYGNSVYPSDKVVLGNGLLYQAPRYYDLLLEKSDPALFDAVKQARVDAASTPAALYEGSIERLIVREKIQLSKLELLDRHL